jgi:hypothetical protein
MRKTLIVAVAATVTGVVVQATSIVPPENFGELARMSHAVVLAQAGGATVVRRGAILYTRTEFSVIAAISGPLTAPSRLIVEVLGGQTADEKWVFPGSPEFLTGAVYLLPLTEKAAGVWLPTMASYGVLRQVRGRDGSTLLEPLPESGTSRFRVRTAFSRSPWQRTWSRRSCPIFALSWRARHSGTLSACWPDRRSYRSG